MVLPDRIELSTSPLPRECSTTELRQHRHYAPRCEASFGVGGYLADGVGLGKSQKAGLVCGRPKGFGLSPPTGFLLLIEL